MGESICKFQGPTPATAIANAGGPFFKIVKILSCPHFSGDVDVQRQGFVVQPSGGRTGERFVPTHDLLVEGGK